MRPPFLVPQRQRRVGTAGRKVYMSFAEVMLQDGLEEADAVVAVVLTPHAGKRCAGESRKDSERESSPSLAPAMVG